MVDGPSSEDLFWYGFRLIKGSSEALQDCHGIKESWFLFSESYPQTELITTNMNGAIATRMSSLQIKEIPLFPAELPQLLQQLLATHKDGPNSHGQLPSTVGSLGRHRQALQEFSVQREETNQVFLVLH